MAIKDNMRKLEKLDSPIDIGDFTIDFGNVDKKKVVFMGTPQFAVPILEMLIENYKGILEYEEYYVKVNTHIGIVNINGFNLKLEQMTGDDIKIIGDIDSMEIEKTEG